MVIDEIKAKLDEPILDEPIKENFKDSCLKGLKEVEESDNEVFLGEASELEFQLFLLASLYRREVRKLEASLMMLDDPSEVDKHSFSHRVHITKSYADMCQEMMFLEANIRFSDTLTSIKSGGVSLRKKDGKLALVSFKTMPNEIPGFLKGLLDKE